MDFDSPDPDVEKEFPGLFASESGANRKKEDDDFSDGDHEKISKKELLLGRRKDKKDKKDRGYATLDGESSPEEDYDTKSPSKLTKKTKTFKFPSKSKEKHEKEKKSDKHKSDKEDEKKKEKEKDVTDSKDKKKEKEKEKKEKEKKEKHKEKDKDKKDKKSKQSSFNEEILELGDVQPIFGVSLGLAVVRSHCHDNINLPLVVRDCIDYLQEHGLQNEQIYKVDALKTKLQQLKKSYNNREMNNTDEFDIPTACSLLKVFIRELPEPLLTTDLLPRFEEIATTNQMPQQQQQQEFLALINQLPGCNRTLLSWLMLHFDAVIKNEKTNKMNIQTLAMLLGPTLQMSHRLLVTMLSNCSVLFTDTTLKKYKPPITSASTSPNLPETADEIIEELKKQDSLLNQIHSEMNAGFVSKKREEQLWEVQRIITQLKRKLRSVEKKHDSMQKSIDDGIGDTDASLSNDALHLIKTKSICSDDESLKTMTMQSTESNTEITPQATPENPTAIEIRLKDPKLHSVSHDVEHHHLHRQQSNPDKLFVQENGLLMLPESHPEYLNLIRLQLENQELTQWKLQLQRRIQNERAEVTRLKAIYNSKFGGNIKQKYLMTQCSQESNNSNNNIPDDGTYERIIANLVRENTLLEQKKNMLANEIFEESKDLIQMQVELAIKKFQI